jgi:NAD(P)H-nitrite reductase large subunit
VVCRCEEVATSDVVNALAKGGRGINDVKRRTRAGMGPCQGRMCAPSVAALVQRLCDSRPEDAQRPSVRPPARPVALGAFAER